MKLRFVIYFNSNSTTGKMTGMDIMMKQIKSYNINDLEILKPPGDSREIQRFYMDLKKVGNLVTKIVKTNGVIFRLKNRRSHSLDNYAIEGGIKNIYAINGRFLRNEESLLFERRLKIKKLIEKTNDIVV